MDFNVLRTGSKAAGAEQAKARAESVQAQTYDVNSLMNATANFFNKTKQLNVMKSNTQAKHAVRSIVESPEYQAATSQERLDMFSAFEENSLDVDNEDMVDAWSDAVASYKYKELGGAEEERKTSIVNQTPGLFKTFVSQLKDNKVPFKEDKIAEHFITNLSESQKVPAANLRDSLMFGHLSESAELIDSASTNAELVTIQKEIANKRKWFKGDKFLDTRSLQTQPLVNAALAAENALLARKQKEFMYAAKEKIELDNDTANPNKLERFTEKPNLKEYQTAYPTDYKQKYQEDFHKYEKAIALRDKAAKFKAGVHNDWSREDEDTKEVYQMLLDDEIASALSKGNIVVSGDLITKHGRTDKSRVANTKQTLLSGLSKKETATGTYALISRLHHEDPAAFSVLFPDYKERAQVIAVGIINRMFPKDIAESWEYVNSTPIITDEKLSRDQIEYRNAFILNSDVPPPMKEEMTVLYNTLAQYGISNGNILPILKDYKTKNPYKLEFGGVAENVQNHMEYHLNKMTIEEYGSVYTDPYTGNYVQTTPWGETMKIIDRKSLLDYSARDASIKKYNDSRFKLVKAGEWVMDNLTTASSQVSIPNLVFTSVKSVLDLTKGEE